MITKTDLIVLFLKCSYINADTTKVKQAAARAITFIELLDCDSGSSSKDKLKMADMQDYLIHNKHGIEILYNKKRGEL